MADSKGLGYGSIAVGSLLVFAGIKGYSLAQAAQDLVQGKNPANEPVTKPISGTPASGAPGTSAGVTSGAFGSLAAIGDSYIGKLTYVFGGPPPPGTVDCSSFASKCLNQAGVVNPGGARFDPNQHGPDTVAYLIWGGAKTVGHTPAAAQVNDLIVYQTHMGICDGPDSMVSAQTPSSGVAQSSISGMTKSLGEFLFVRRLIAPKVPGPGRGLTVG